MGYLFSKLWSLFSNEGESIWGIFCLLLLRAKGSSLKREREGVYEISVFLCKLRGQIKDSDSDYDRHSEFCKLYSSCYDIGAGVSKFSNL